MTLRDYRDALKVREGYWFAPKLFGWGAAPVTWQGWLTTFAYIALIALLASRVPDQQVRIATIVLVTIAFIGFVWTKTDGGFRWRWGPERD